MTDDLAADAAILRRHLLADYRGMCRPAGGAFRYPFLTPGSVAYADVLWDWDSWLSDIALRQILREVGDPAEAAAALPHERGCVLNFLAACRGGWIPIYYKRDDDPTRLMPPRERVHHENMHKPCLAQHAAFLVQQDGDAEWLREGMPPLQQFVGAYRNHHRHPCGLYYWQTDDAIGVDNDPCTFGRPPKSSGSIYLNGLMYQELLAVAWLCRRLGLGEQAVHWERDAAELAAAIQAHCWDERDGFFYSVDLNLAPVSHDAWLHQGMPRDWPCLIQRIGVWSGFLPLWAGIASPAQAERLAAHARDERSFRAPWGIRTLSRQERMYNLRSSGNPSSWLGPIWGISNYLVFRGLVRYGFSDQARALGRDTVRLFARDLERFGALHEYYLPESGEPALNRGFQNWNYLVLNILAWLEGREPVAELVLPPAAG